MVSANFCAALEAARQLKDLLNMNMLHNVCMIEASTGRTFFGTLETSLRCPIYTSGISHFKRPILTVHSSPTVFLGTFIVNVVMRSMHPRNACDIRVVQLRV